MSLTAINKQAGISQAERRLATLATDYIALDERSVSDWLRFVRGFAKHVYFYNETNLYSDLPAGDWENFFNLSDDDIIELLAFVDDPTQFANDSEKTNRYAQPHLAMMVNFLRLLRHPQQQLADVTGRHLDFYYREALQLAQRAAQADRVHVLFNLSGGATSQTVQQGA